MKKMSVFRIMLVLGVCFFLNACLGDGFAELRGEAKPDVNPAVPQVAEAKVYKVTQTKIVEAVKRCLKKEDIDFTSGKGEGKAVRITTEQITVQQVSLMRSMMGGSNYYAQEIIDVEPNGRVTFKARFKKSFSDKGVTTENLKYPEKENELRAKFFEALDKEL